MNKYRVKITPDIYVTNAPTSDYWYTPQKRKYLFWWKNISRTFSTLEGAERSIQLHKLETLYTYRR